ncbi:hypothetical protein BRC83_03615 [Halobacteriales archaeon QS_1_68_17]|nr:MAG: hypothetical protein BRC83_03615 [Halobacteriales archaeon QS_1_68_17]
MGVSTRGGTVAGLAGLAAGPGVVAGQTLDPSAVAAAPSFVRVAGGFLLVLVFGGVLRWQFEARVVRAVEVSTDRPLNSILYGTFAQVAVLFLGVYVISQLGQVGVGGRAVDAVALVTGVFVMTLAGFGFTVVGIFLVRTAGERRLSVGVVVGAGLGAVVWLLPSFLLGLLAWVAVVGLGVGGPTREWLHASQTEVDTGG